MKKLYAWMMILLLLCAAVPALAAERITLLCVTPDTETSAESPYAVNWYKYSGNTWYLFLPSGWDASALRLWFEGPETLEWDGAAVSSGDAVSLAPGSEFTVKNGKTKLTLHILQSANIPSVHIRLDSGSLEKIEASKANTDTGSILFLNADGSVEDEQSLAEMKCRGNISFTFAKKNYRVKLASKKNLFGMGKSKTWVLTGNYRDKSNLRNRITYDMALYAGMYGSTESVFADLYVQGEYRGLYLLSEKVQVGKNRVDIYDLEKATEALNTLPLSDYAMLGSKKPQKENGKYYDIPNDPEDITGGYLVELRANKSHYTEATSAYYTSRGLTMDFHAPDYLSQKQYTYISTLLQSFENAIFAEDGIDPDTGKSYTDICDLQSLVCKYLVEEISKNYDGNRSSQFFYKDSDSVSEKLFAGPAWDYDSAYGAYGTKKSMLKPTGFWINVKSGTYWYPRIYAHEDFQQAVTETWRSTFLPALNILLGENKDPEGRLLSLREYESMISASAGMNLVRWPRKHGGTPDIGVTLSETVDFLEDYLTRRRNWLMTQWGE